MNLRIFALSFYLLIYFSSYLYCMEDVESNNWLDRSFGINGIIITDFGIHSGTFNKLFPGIHIKIQPNKKILIIGDAYKFSDKNHPKSNIALVRYNSDGSLDDTFGIQGQIILNIAKLDSFGVDIALQKDGKIIVVARIFDREIDCGEACLIRLNENGTIDEAFGCDGLVRQNDSGLNWSNFWRVIIQEDGKIVAIGDKGLNSNEISIDHSAIFIARYTANGLPDLSFGMDGKIETVIKTTNLIKPEIEGKEADLALSVALQSDKKIVVVGYTDNMVMNSNEMTDYPDCALVRYEQNGELDISFGQDKTGMIVTSASPHYNYLVDVAIQPDGKIVAIGVAKNEFTGKDEFVVARYLNDGTLDESFGENYNGLVLMALGTSHAHPKNVLLQEDGRILVTGNVTWDDYSKFTVVRYTQDGLLDHTFGENGIIITSIGNADDKSFAMAMQDDGKLVVVGNSFDGKKYNFALVRYNIDATSQIM